MTPRFKYHLRVIGLSVLMGLSIASFAYLNSIDDRVRTLDVLVEEVEEEKSELLPDVQLIKMLMNKTLDFVTHVRRI